MSRFRNLPDAEPRLQTIDGSVLGIKTFGIDNGYPQRMLNLYNASGSAKMCANLCATYIIGKGFQDLGFYHSKINSNGLTPDKLLRRLAHDKSKFRGFSFHVNYNAIYKIESVNYIPFENCREGALDNEGKIGVYSNWYDRIKLGRYRRKTEVDFIDKYNPDPVIIERQVNEAGGWDSYKGQVFYASDDFETYPLSVIDPVLDDVQAEIESARTRRNNLKNNFQLKHLWIEKGKAEDTEEQGEIVKNIQDLMGPEGKPVMVVISTEEDNKDAPTLVPIQSMVNDKLFQYTDQTARLSIYTQYGQPAVLHSDYLGASGFNEGQLPQSMAYYNSFTEPDRILFEETFTEIFENFKETITTNSNYSITPLQVLQNGNTFNSQQV